VSDAEKLLDNWGGGELGDSAKDYYTSLHRVAYYGDHTSSIRHLGHLLGMKVVAECLTATAIRSRHGVTIGLVAPIAARRSHGPIRPGARWRHAGECSTRQTDCRDQFPKTIWGGAHSVHAAARRGLCEPYRWEIHSGNRSVAGFGSDKAAGSVTFEEELIFRALGVCRRRLLRGTKPISVQNLLAAGGIGQFDESFRHPAFPAPCRCKGAGPGRRDYCPWFTAAAVGDTPPMDTAFTPALAATQCSRSRCYRVAANAHWRCQHIGVVFRPNPLSWGRAAST